MRVILLCAGYATRLYPLTENHPKPLLAVGNKPILEWILDRVGGEGEAVETAIGYVPKANALDLAGLSLKPGTVEALFSINTDEWLEDLKSQEEFFGQFGDRLPQMIKQEVEALTLRVDANSASLMRIEYSLGAWAEKQKIQDEAIKRIKQRVGIS